MKRRLFVFLIILILGLITGCAYLQKKDEPPELPAIEETKPPLTMKSKYFEAFPWNDLATPHKDGNDPDTFTYNAKEGDTIDSIAENWMGNVGLAKGLAEYNGLPLTKKLSAEDKIVIPNPIIGISSQVKVKAKGEKEFGPPQLFNTELKTGDQYKLRFESNVDGYLYVFRHGAKGVVVLYPTAVKKGKRNKTTESLQRNPGKIKAHDPVELPIGRRGYLYDAKKAGDKIYVFLSLKENRDLDDLKEKKRIKEAEIQGIMRAVKEEKIFSEPPYHLLRITNPEELLGFSLNISG
jgi:hypothetical protein